MTVPYRKKLIEVGLPLVAINAESAREQPHSATRSPAPFSPHLAEGEPGWW
jgi:adenine-specific DNA methylase